MKSIFYVGAALMLGASVYGFVDYRNAKSQKEFKELYKPDETSVGKLTKPESPSSEGIAREKVESKKAAFTEENAPAKVKMTKESSLGQELQGEPDQSEIEALKTGNPTPSIEKVSSPGKKNKHGKKKKLSSKLFSRAAPLVEFEPPKQPFDDTTTKGASQ